MEYFFVLFKLLQTHFVLVKMQATEVCRVNNNECEINNNGVIKVKKNLVNFSTSSHDKIPPTISTLQELVGELHQAFATDVVDIDYVQELMASYKSNPQDWRKYAKFDRYR